MTSLGELLAECDAHGIRLLAAGDGNLILDAPQGALTPDLKGRLKARKGELLTLLGAMPNLAPASPAASMDTLGKPAAIVCRCGSAAWRDVPIHGGHSNRRDCDRCGRFIDFSIWCGKDTLHNEQ